MNNCCNADGYFTPLFVVYKAKRNFRAEWALDGPTGTKYSISKSSWMEHDTFIEWLKEVYIPECQAISGTHILHLDGQCMCSMQNTLQCMCILHTAHALQQLFKVIKVKYIALQQC